MQTVDSNHPNYFDTYAEADAFAVHLDASTAQSDDPEGAPTILSGYDLADRLQEVATSRVEAIKEHFPEDPTDNEQAELEYWQLEHQTWEIFAGLTSHRLNSKNEMEIENDISLELVQNKYTSNARFRQFLMQSDPRFKEWTLILNWLLQYAPDPMESFDDGAPGYGSGWMYTKESLKSKKRLAGKKLLSLQANSNMFFAKKADRKNLITELDPDAPSRQHRQLEEEDEEAERNFMKFLWGWVRKGDISGARRVCDESGEWWRGASLSGNDEAHDYNIDGHSLDVTVDEAAGSSQAVVGNRRRELWRRMCFAIARKQGGDDWEKAVYGVLCGDVESVSHIQYSILSTTNATNMALGTTRLQLLGRPSFRAYELARRRILYRLPYKLCPHSLLRHKIPHLQFHRLSLQKWHSQRRLDTHAHHRLSRCRAGPQG